MNKESETKRVIVHKVNDKFINQYFINLLNKIENGDKLFSTRYVRLDNIIVRVLVYNKNLDSHICRELSFILMDDIPVSYDYTIVAWVSPTQNFEKKEHKVVRNSDSVSGFPLISVDEETGRTIGYDFEHRCFYYGFPSSLPEDFALEGHVFIRQFYYMLKPLSNISLVHGACVGINRKGVLFCAKGNRGKSTLTVLSLLRGFEYVSDDYLVITKKGNELFADPIYSIVTLSPRMYDEMYDELGGTRFISNNWNKSKYILNIENFHNSFRTSYPVKVCMFPEIVQDSDSSIVPCSAAEKGRAITNMVYSTVTQTGDSSDAQNAVKLMNLLKNQIYFKINLCSDIHKNVECLRTFLCNYHNNFNYDL